jgi:hypothetical protein
MIVLLLAAGVAGATAAILLLLSVGIGAHVFR